MTYTKFLRMWRKQGSEAATKAANEQGVEQQLILMWTSAILRKYR